tara:strand:- start:224 stop:1657 length:1434 start_codon:yes stop_codon:yes gene_type:complete
MAFKIPKKKQVDHRKPLTVSSWQPRTPNRGEPLEFDSYRIFLANKEARIALYFVDREKKEIICKINGPLDPAYAEALKKIPLDRLEDFKESWMNTKLDYVFSGTQLVNKLSKPDRKKPDFQIGNKKIEIKVDRSKKQIIDLGYFNYQNPNQILADKIRESELDISQIAEKVNLHVSMVSKQMKGERDITRDHAFAYAKFFGCDPADILFAAPQVPIWSTVDFLKFRDSDMPFNPGECVANQGQREYVVCPRDIYRPDVKAIKVDSPGSYLDGMVLFYYATSDVKQDCIGRLSIVGSDDDGDDELMQELRFGEKQRYYIGILEQSKGRTKLLNPDPFAQDENVNNGIVINNIIPTFASPIVGVVNPKQIKKDKHSSKLFKHNDEVFRLQRQMEEQRAKQESILKTELQRASAQAAKAKHDLKKELDKQLAELEKLTKKIEEEKKSRFLSGIGSLFYPNQKGLLDGDYTPVGEEKKKRA